MLLVSSASPSTGGTERMLLVVPASARGAAESTVTGLPPLWLPSSSATAATADAAAAAIALVLEGMILAILLCPVVAATVPWPMRDSMDVLGRLGRRG